MVLATLNYDDLLDSTLDWANGFSAQGGRPYKIFDPLAWRDTELQARHLLIHLHGSIRFGLRAHDDLHVETAFDEPALYPNYTLAALSLAGRTTSHKEVDGQYLVASAIVAGGDKGAKLIYNTRPYAYYFATAQREVSSADALLIVGYGWRDEHVNSWIDEYPRLHPYGRVVVITKRTGNDVGNNTPQERYLKVIGGDAWRRKENFVFEPVPGGSDRC